MNKAHIQARSAVYIALNNGRLVKPLGCEQCQRRGDVQAHHYQGYDKPNHLAVQWLCRSCHWEQHPTEPSRVKERRNLKYPDVHVRFNHQVRDVLEYLELRAKNKRTTVSKILLELAIEEISRNPL